MKAHRPSYLSTLGSRVMKKKKREVAHLFTEPELSAAVLFDHSTLPTKNIYEATVAERKGQISNDVHLKMPKPGPYSGPDWLTYFFFAW